ncbi:hypothetical protein [Stenotrophomonas sp. GZD-301]|uniref:hypothetical protein n=1 Tax=Stenotrophomonas sp. GZD-301 TaxID=3404814 RepID=UPI003BB81602
MGSDKYFDLVPGGTGSSRVGGCSPDALVTSGQARPGSRFFVCLAASDFPALAGQDVSIVIDDGFLPSGENTRYPDIGVQCYLHAPSAESADDSTSLGSIARGSLVPASGGGDIDAAWFVKLGGAPRLIQEEDYYARALVRDGYEFLFQVDENGFPDGFVLGDYPLGYGALYVYGTRGNGGEVVEVEAGFTQF